MNKAKILAIFLGVATLFSGILMLIGILLLPAEIAPPEQSVQENISGIGYSEEIPSATLLFLFDDSSGVLLHLDFNSFLTNCYIFDEKAEENADALPYDTLYTLTADKGFLPRLADRLGGLEIEEENGSKSLYFSPALTEFCEKGLNEEKRLALALSFFDKIAKTGLSSEDFMFIIEETENNLSYSVCYDWISHIKVMFSNIVFG